MDSSQHSPCPTMKVLLQKTMCFPITFLFCLQNPSPAGRKSKGWA